MNFVYTNSEITDGKVGEQPRNSRWQSLLLVPFIVRASLRVSLLAHSHDLRAISARLRRGKHWARGRRNPELVAAATDRLCAVLPPWGMGRCLKRSLILLDLWSRCGLQPSLHLGIRSPADGRWEGHAWLSASGLPAGEQRYVEMAVL